MKNKYLLGLLLLLGFFREDCKAQTWDWAITNRADFTGIMESSPTAVDGLGNVFSAGMMFAADSISFGSFTVSDTDLLHQMVILKADATGALQWVFTTEHSFSQVADLAADALGNLYVLGTYTDTACIVGSIHLSNPAGGLMYFLFKLSPAGTPLWAENIANSAMTMMGGIGLDNERYVYVTGSYGSAGATIGTTTLTNANPANGSSDIFIAKYTAFGSPIWAYGFGGGLHDMGSYITVHPDGTFYIAGQFSSDTMSIGSTTLTDSAFVPSVSMPGFYPYFAKFDKNGNNLWAQAARRHVHIMDIKTDLNRNFYLGGNVDSTIVMGKDTLRVNGMQNALVSKYDSTGQVIWSNAPHGKNYSTIYSLDVDACGNVWTGGSTDTSATVADGHIINAPAVYSDRMYLAAFDKCGRYIPSSGTALGSGGDDRLDVVLDGMGHLYFGGDYNFIPMRFGADSLLAPLTATQEYFLLARYTYGPMPCDTAACCYVIPYANFTDTGAGTVTFTYTGGATYDSLLWDFGDTTNATATNPSHTFAPGTYRVCLTVYTTCGNDTICKDVHIAATGITHLSYEPEITVYPNPSSNGYTIYSKAGFVAGTMADVYDATGRRVGSYTLSGNSTAISTTGFAPGVYHCTITAPDHSVVKKQLVVK